MYSRVKSAVTLGIKGYLVDVETHIANGLPRFKIVGLPDKAVEEAKERVTAAIKSSGYSFPLKRITISLAPANIPKHGPLLDLPIAIGILISSRQLNLVKNTDEIMFCGELGLDGSLKKTPGAPILVQTAIDYKIKNLIIPNVCQTNYPGFKYSKILKSANLSESAQFLEGAVELISESAEVNCTARQTSPEIRFSDIRGNSFAKRAALIAAAGHHHLSLSGPPGCGKTMLSQAIIGIMPELSPQERFEVEKIYSISNEPFPYSRPFRSPHHTSSTTSILGGGIGAGLGRGNNFSPGEITFAHHGILFLDEFPEFPKNVINALRQPIEARKIQISRKFGTINFPCDFILITAMNPCPCGYLGHPTKSCRCKSYQITNYQNRISNAIWDRVDINIQVDQSSFGDISGDETSSSTDPETNYRNTVAGIWEIQRKRKHYNSRLNLADVQKICPMTRMADRLLQDSFTKLGLSTRGLLQVMRVARTIADLENSERINEEHIAEAVSYRRREN